jgi:hypothetical protein
MSNPLTPNQLAFLATVFKQLQEQRLEADRQAKALKEQEDLTKIRILEGLAALNISSIGAGGYQVTRKPKDIPVVTDWEEFTKYIIDTKDLSLLERRPSKAALTERRTGGNAVPGTGTFTDYSLSFTKLKG